MSLTLLYRRRLARWSGLGQRSALQMAGVQATWITLYHMHQAVWSGC